MQGDGQERETVNAVVSIIGCHAGASPSDILEGKMSDIRDIGMVFWAIRSWKARPSMVIGLAAKQHVTFCHFVASSGASNAKPLGNSRSTTVRDIAKEWSTDKENWNPMPLGMREVTGKLSDGMGHALVFESIRIEQGVLDLSDYCSFDDEGLPARTGLGFSTICVKEKNMRGHPQQLKNSKRELSAVAKLKAPFAVWLR